jgi:hypothetical protein
MDEGDLKDEMHLAPPFFVKGSEIASCQAHLKELKEEHDGLLARLRTGVRPEPTPDLAGTRSRRRGAHRAARAVERALQAYPLRHWRFLVVVLEDDEESD